jgi:hypothetical protein
MKKDIHGILNLMIGISLLLVVGIYSDSMSIIPLSILSVSGALLVMRELWMQGGGVVWSVNDKDPVKPSKTEQIQQGNKH